jgi:hypothetical protein
MKMEILKYFSLWVKSKIRILKNGNVYVRKKYNKDAILFISHIYSDAIADRFLKIKNSTNNDFDTFALVDASNKFSFELWEKRLKYKESSNALFPFYSDELENILGFKYFIKKSITPGCAHYPLIFFGRQFEYSNYWIIEYDVDFSGSWGELFNHFKNIHDDLLISHLTRFHINPTWQWWGSLHPPRRLAKAIHAKQATLPKAFTPIYRISERALRAVDAAHRQKWRGHCEVLLPVVLEESGAYSGASRPPIPVESGH